jgi:uncharacterized protein YaeQ
MALTATVYNLDVELSNVDRNVYESLSLRIACQPSETPEYFLTRALAYCLEYTEGIGFSGGITEPELPSIFVRDLTGTMKVWIDIGHPDAARLHKANKAAHRVAIYTHKDPAQLLRSYAGEKIFKAESIDLFAMDRGLLAALAERLDRRMKLALSVNEGQLYIDLGGKTFEGVVEKHSLVSP